MLYTTLLLGVPLLIASIWFYTTTRPTPTTYPHNQNLLLLIGHPDDEAMFFGPTLLSLASPQHLHSISILCISSGTADGKKETRQKELKASCKILGIPERRLRVLHELDLLDGMHNTWDPELVRAHIEQFEREVDGGISNGMSGFDAIITFDENGVSSHPNHKSCLAGARAWKFAPTPPSPPGPEPEYVSIFGPFPQGAEGDQQAGPPVNDVAPDAAPNDEVSSVAERPTYGPGNIVFPPNWLNDGPCFRTVCAVKGEDFTHNVWPTVVALGSVSSEWLALNNIPSEWLPSDQISGPMATAPDAVPVGAQQVGADEDIAPDAGPAVTSLDATPQEAQGEHTQDVVPDAVPVGAQRAGTDEDIAPDANPAVISLNAAPQEAQAEGTDGIAPDAAQLEIAEAQVREELRKRQPTEIYVRKKKVFTLTSVPIYRKYLSIIDALFTRNDMVFVSTPSEFRTTQKAMTAGHVSQMKWFRYGWITFSRYMVVNDLKVDDGVYVPAPPIVEKVEKVGAADKKADGAAGEKKRKWRFW